MRLWSTRPSSVFVVLIGALGACETPPSDPDADTTASDTSSDSDVVGGSGAHLAWTYGLSGGLVAWNLSERRATVERAVADQPTAPSLSPAGHVLAYVRANVVADGHPLDALARVDVLTGSESRLTVTVAERYRRASSPSVSADGEVAFLETLVTYQGASPIAFETRIASWSGAGEPAVIVAATAGESPASSGPVFIADGAAVVFASDAPEPWVTSPGFYRATVPASGDPSLVASYDVVSIERLDLAASPCSWAVSAEGDRFAFMAVPSGESKRAVYVLDAGSEPERVGSIEAASCVSMSADGETILVLDADPSAAGETRIWRIHGDAPATPEAYTGPSAGTVTALALSRDGTQVAFGTRGPGVTDNAVIVSDFASATPGTTLATSLLPVGFVSF